MKDFILTYWKQILDILSILVCLIFFILKKKPINSLEGILYRCCIFAVLDAENSGILGPEAKLNYALDYVRKYLADEYPILDFTRFKRLIVSYIELILSTPNSHKRKENNLWVEK